MPTCDECGAEDRYLAKPEFIKAKLSMAPKRNYDYFRTNFKFVFHNGDSRRLCNRCYEATESGITRLDFWMKPRIPVAIID